MAACMSLSARALRVAVPTSTSERHPLQPALPGELVALPGLDDRCFPQASRRSAVTVRAGAAWLPGTEAPAHLASSTLPGNFGQCRRPRVPGGGYESGSVP